MEALLASILGFFAFGTIGFWLLVITLSIVYTCAVELDKHGFAIFCTIVAAILGWKVIGPLFQHWQLLLLGVATYGVVGGAWSVFRWFKYCRKWITGNPYEDATTSELKDWHNGVEIRLNPEQYYAKNLKPSEHKSRLIGWIVYWPFSFLWTIAGDLITSIYESLAGIYHRVSTHVIARALEKK
jgi:hypothetical protein